MMTAFFVQMEAINKGASRPEGIPRHTVTRLGVLGAGQMGAGLATVAARRGIEVVLKDVDLERAEQGKAYAEQSYAGHRRTSEEQAREYLARIHPTADYADLADCDLVIEAVFEDRELKDRVTRDVEAVQPGGAGVRSRACHTPSNQRAEASARPGLFIGMHRSEERRVGKEVGALGRG